MAEQLDLTDATRVVAEHLAEFYGLTVSAPSMAADLVAKAAPVIAAQVRAQIAVDLQPIINRLGFLPSAYTVGPGNEMRVIGLISSDVVEIAADLARVAGGKP